jgi:LPXTG-site transpeptidase (sortase) family protein
MDLPVYQEKRNKPPKAVFLAATIVVFFCTLSAADSIGFIPCALDGTCTVAPVDNSVALSNLPMLGETIEVSPQSNPPVVSGVEPVRIEIGSVGIDLPVQNPATRDVDALDALLQQGPARYVDSAKLGEDGNVVIFAHSSHLPVVHNQMFKAFNNIPDMKQGDPITLIGEDGTRYLYSVDLVVQASTNDGTEIPLSPSLGRKLTLVTCDTLTGKSARYILTATLVGTI